MANLAADLGPLEERVAARLKTLEREQIVARIWARDPTVWKPPGAGEIVDRLGWLEAPEWMTERLGELSDFAAELSPRLSRFVLCGMGGASLAAEVLRQILGGSPGMVLLDTTHPAAVAVVDRCSDSRTLYLIASKSGTTQETTSLMHHYWHATGGAGERFLAITDPETPLARLAVERGFRRTFLNREDIGGRYSALSYFGLVPAALLGAPVAELVAAAQEMARRCREVRDLAANPGAWLGCVLGEAALEGRNKLTFLLSPRLAGLGLWLEQLVAESTGKEGKGIVPVTGEPPGPPAVYGDDRLFVEITWQDETPPGPPGLLESLGKAGHPWVRISLEEVAELGGEFFRWEFATAVACSILGVNPFDQPNVAESKENTRAVLSGRVAATAELADRRSVARLLEGIQPGEYLALMVYLPPSAELDQRLSRLQGALRDRLKVPVTAGYGPRLLHSIGQLHKGGPACGRFIQMTDRYQFDLPIPGEGITFGQLIAAQAEGDYRALESRGRPVVRVLGLDLLEEVLQG